MFKKSLTALALAGLSTSALAQDPNIEPGMWETTSTVTMNIPNMPEGSMPPQTQTSSECVSAEDIQSGQAFIEDNEDCTMSDQDLRDDGMTFTMTCGTPDGGEMVMNVDFGFEGDTMSGKVDGQMESAMGAMSMNVEVSGRRTGDC